MYYKCNCSYLFEMDLIRFVIMLNKKISTMSAFIVAIFLNQVSAATETDEQTVKLNFSTVKKPQGLDFKLWAGPDKTTNPAFFTLSPDGKMYVAEAHRAYHGVDDVRGFPLKQTIEDIQIKTLDDRLKLYQGYSDTKPISYYTKTSDQVRLLIDNNKDGRADTAKLFADNFNDPLDGIGSGVITRDDKVYYTNIPHLWLLEDKDQNGLAEKRTSLQTGFGTRVSFLGHDMHGLAWGPDGRLYWTIGDRGYYFTNKEGKTFDGQNIGAVFRSNPDGSNIEVFYTGLRNPTELAFDEFGNLFTAENDGDHGDFERINHLVEGGDSGWHAGHQSIMSFSKKLGFRSYKYAGKNKVPTVWIERKMSLPRNDDQPAFMLPSITKLYTGPSGITYNPSNYLGEEWKNTFFISSFAGSRDGSYIISLKTHKNGASFLTSEPTEFLRGINASDIDFGLDGKFYIAEFNFGGWNAEGEGAIYTLEKPGQVEQEQDNIKLVNNLKNLNLSQLAQHLSNDNQRIRQLVQFEMAKQGKAALSVFKQIAENNHQDLFSRIHSIWGISQLVFQNDISKDKLKSLIHLLTDDNSHIRAQVTRVLSDHTYANAEPELIKALNDDNAQVGMYAAIGLGKIGKINAVNAIINKLNQVEDQDLWLRHGLVMALSGIDKSAWIKYKTHASKYVRLGVLLALRKRKDSEISDFLTDENDKLVREAVYAISDLQLLSERSKLADLLNQLEAHKEPALAYTHHRIINANFNEGRLDNAKQILKFALNNDTPQRLVVEALAAIEAWHEQNPIDAVTGLPSNINPERSNIEHLVKQALPQLLKTKKDLALVQSLRLAKQYQYQVPTPTLKQITLDDKSPTNTRLQTLNLLASNDQTQAVDIAIQLLSASSTKVKTGAFNLILANKPNLALNYIEDYLSSSIDEQKIALAAMPAKTNAKIENKLIQLMQQLLSKQHQPSLTIELVAAAKNSNNQALNQMAAQYEANLSKLDLLAQYQSTLVGGDIEKGKQIVMTGGASQCLRCHRINGSGSRVGPSLTNIAQDYSPEYLLQALIEPSATIAPYFGTFTLTLNDNSKISGLFVAETEQSIQLKLDNDQTKTFTKNNIKQIKRPTSGMPPMGYILSKAEIRDVLAYLQTLKGKRVKSGH